MQNYLTIDVEEWYQTVLFGKDQNQASSLPQDLDNILLMLDEHNIRATFFIVGSVAQKYPASIRAIAKQGHEIASHGFLHKLVYRMSKDEFANDINKSIGTLEEITNIKVSGYRACTWSITEKMLWAIDILEAAGLRYDSSIYPVSLNPLKNKYFKNIPYKIKNNFLEFSPSVFNFLGWNIPFAGGTFLRFFSSSFMLSKIIQLNKAGYPAMLYFHSWEFDNQVALASDMPAWKRFIQYKNVGTVKHKIETMANNLKLGPISNSL
ncbi:MAG: polysaccharide deacetylase family protein [Candidatus Omnitrophica bacterium]|nr:polysaccharide deacetylase family protein [Candidatus Omnitrophota bacterium]